MGRAIELAAASALSGTVAKRASVSGRVAAAAQVAGTVGIGAVYRDDVDTYEGDYTVVPTVGPQVLATAHKQMREDVTVYAIPYAEVTNTANGTTVTIG